MMVYFIQAAGNDRGPIKIGFTENSDLTPRLRDLQVGNPQSLRVLGVIASGSQQDEYIIHKKFSALRVSGEWFQYNRKLETFIRKKSKGYCWGKTEEEPILSPKVTPVRETATQPRITEPSGEVIKAFAAKYRLKARRSPDDSDAPSITGKNGQIYVYSDTELAVSFLPGVENGRGVGTWTPKTWGNFRRKAVGLGMTVRQNGDSEGSLSFDPTNREQSRLALKIARVRQKRELTPERLAAIRANFAKAREFHVSAS